MALSFESIRSPDFTGAPELPKLPPGVAVDPAEFQRLSEPLAADDLALSRGHPFGKFLVVRRTFVRPAGFKLLTDDPVCDAVRFGGVSDGVRAHDISAGDEKRRRECPAFGVRAPSLVGKHAFKVRGRSHAGAILHYRGLDRSVIMLLLIRRSGGAPWWPVTAETRGRHTRLLAPSGSLNASAATSNKRRPPAP